MERKTAIVFFIVTFELTCSQENYNNEQSSSLNDTDAIDLEAITQTSLEIFVEMCPGENRYTEIVSEIFSLATNSTTYTSVSNYCDPFTFYRQQTGITKNLLVISHSYLAEKNHLKGIEIINLNDHLLLHQSNYNMGVRVVDSIISNNYSWKHVYFYTDRYYGEGIDHLTNWNSSYFVHSITFVEFSSPKNFVKTLHSMVAYHQRLIIVLTNSSIATQLMAEATLNGMLDRNNYWIIFGDANFIPVIELRIDSNIYQVRHNGLITNLTSLITYYVQENEDFQSSINNIMFKEIKLKMTKVVLGEKKKSSELPIATWTPADGFQAIEKEIWPTRPNYHKAVLTAITYQTPPYVLIETHGEKNELKYTGYFVEALEAVANYLNFTVRYIEVKQAIPGVSGNTQLQKMIEYINNKSADIGLFDFSLTLDRLPKMDFARVALDTYTLVGVFRRPDHKTIAVEKVGGYIEPLEVRVWLASLVAVLLLVVTFHAAIRVNKRLTEDAGGAWLHENATVSKSALLAIRSFAGQGTEDNVEGSISGRVIFLSLWMFALIFATAYSTTLMSHLAVTKIPWPFKTLEELAQNNDFHIGFRIGSGSYYLFQNSGSEMRRQIFQRSIDDSTKPNVNLFDEGLVRATKDKYVFMVSKRAIEYLTRNSCLLALSNSLTAADIVTITFQKASPHAHTISRAFRALNDGGILYRLRQKWWARDQICSKDDKSFISFTLRNVAPAFIILLGGVACSLVVMAIEHCVAGTRSQVVKPIY